MLDTQASVIPLFSSPVLYTSMDVTEETVKYVESQAYGRTAKNDGYLSYDTYILEHPALKYVRESIQGHLNYYLYEVLKFSPDLRVNITNSWIVKHIKGDSSPTHFHANSFISGIYYIRVSPKSGFLKFIGNNNATLFPGFQFNVKEYNYLNSSSWSILPNVGTVIIFPSMLPHEVTPCEDDINRLCISFNAFIDGPINTKAITPSGLTHLTLKSSHCGKYQEKL